MRRDLLSIQYWQRPEERVPQRFYFAFCLLMSSIQDALLGQKERESNNLNWSATCSYYSLVHGGRFLCFLAFGDYPKQHEKLRDIFSTNQQQPHTITLNPSKKYPFNWLESFERRVSGQSPPVSYGQATQTLYTRQILADYLNEIYVPNSEERLTKYGKILRPAAELRNDSNYEALLIAHEYGHAIISKAFDNLSLSMVTAAESTLPFLIDSFNGFLANDPDLHMSRNKYEEFLHVYVQDRIGVAIKNKLGGSIDLERKLGAILESIGTGSTGVQFSELENMVSMMIFQGKKHLMRDFESKIKDLSQVTGSYGNLTVVEVPQV